MEVLDPGKVARARRRVDEGIEVADLTYLRDVLCEPARLRIVEALGAEELSVGDLATAIDRKLPATSQHLRVLRVLGLVEARREARTVYYRIRPGTVSERVQTIVDSLRRGADAAT